MLTPSDARIPRYLGAAFVFQFATSLSAGLLSTSILAGSITDVLMNVSSNTEQMRATIVLELLTSVGIIVMTSLLYVVLSDQNRAVALVALGLWMAEAVMLAVKSLGLSTLVAVSAGYVDAGSPTASPYQTVGSAASGVSEHAADIGMLFFCLGGLLWYSLLLQSRIVPRLLALWGLVAVPLVMVATSLLVWNPSLEPSIALYALYVPFELVLGLWLLVRGADVASTRPGDVSARGVDIAERKDVGNASGR
jgi:hypothetical protein